MQRQQRARRLFRHRKHACFLETQFRSTNNGRAKTGRYLRADLHAPTHALDAIQLTDRRSEKHHAPGMGASHGCHGSSGAAHRVGHEPEKLAHLRLHGHRQASHQRRAAFVAGRITMSRRIKGQHAKTRRHQWRRESPQLRTMPLPSVQQADQRTSRLSPFPSGEIADGGRNFETTRRIQIRQLARHSPDSSHRMQENRSGQFTQHQRGVRRRWHRHTSLCCHLQQDVRHVRSKPGSLRLVERGRFLPVNAPLDQPERCRFDNTPA